MKLESWPYQSLSSGEDRTIVARVVLTEYQPVGDGRTDNTPGHPEASGMVERFNQTCKNMLSHVVQEHQRHWHKYVPLMVWALREVPNATTGVSPYMLVYGRVPRGPLAVLKETWAGERELPPGLGKPVEEYLLDLRDKLGTAAQYATDHSGKQQASYVGRYNLRARHKKFHEGDQVIVLAQESSGKLLNKWHSAVKTQAVDRHLPNRSALLVRLTPATSSATPRSTANHGFSSARVMTTLCEITPALQLDLSPSLPWIGSYEFNITLYTLLEYEGRLSATLTASRPSTVHTHRILSLIHI